MKARIVRIGNSRGIYLPKALLKKAQLGDEVQLRAEPGRILISKIAKPRIGWAEAAQRMRARNEDRDLGRDDDGESQLGLLAGQANKALTRMIGKLDGAHVVVSTLRRSLAARKR